MTLTGAWTKSSYSTNGYCVEGRHDGVVVQVRDSKAGDGSPVLSFEPRRWAEFVAAVRSGELRAN